MEFWRIVRLALARRGWIAGSVAVTAAALYLGTWYQASSAESVSEATLSLLEPPPPTAPGEASPAALDPNKRISQIYQGLKSNRTVFLDAAGLLRLDETRRRDEVLFILERNSFFAGRDAELEDRLSRSEPDPVRRAPALATARQEARTSAVAALATARDAGGPYAAAGVASDAGALADELQGRIDFETVAAITSVEGNPQFDPLVRVRGHFKRPAEADLAVNMVCIAFMQEYARQNRSASTVRVQQLTRQRDLLQTDLNAAYARLRRFRGQGKVEALAGPNDQLLTRLQSYETERDRAQRDYEASAQQASSYRAALASTNRLTTITLPASQSPDVIRAQERFNDAKVKFDQIQQSNLGPGDDDYKAAEAALGAARTALDDAKARTYTQSQLNGQYLDLEAKLRGAEAARDAAAGTLRRYRQQIDALNQELARLPAAQAELANVERQIKVLESKIGQTEQQLTSAATESANRSGAVTLASPAGPVAPAAGSRWRLIVYGTLLAFALSLTGVVVWDALDNSLRRREDIEELLGLPVAGVIPAQLPDPRRAPLVAFLDPLSPVSESYRLLRTDILFTAAEFPFQSLMVLASRPRQGATTTASNLAITLAQAGKRVILVDADLRRPKLHDLYRVSNQVGLTSVLNRQCSVEEALQPTEVENLLLLPSGPLPLNPSELLGSEAFRDLHTSLKPHTHFIIIDVPAAIAYTDAEVLASVVDACLIVVRAGDVPRDAERQVRARLEKARANVIGSVLNGANPDQVDAVFYQTRFYPEIEAGSVNMPSLPSSERPGAHTAPVAPPEPQPEPEPVVAETAPEPITPEAEPEPEPDMSVEEEPDGESVQDNIRRRLKRLNLG